MASSRSAMLPRVRVAMIRTSAWKLTHSSVVPSKQRVTGSHASQHSIDVALCILRYALIVVAATKSLAPCLAGVARNNSWRARQGPWLCQRAALNQQGPGRHRKGKRDRHEVVSRWNRTQDASQANSVSERKFWNYYTAFLVIAIRIATWSRPVTSVIRHMSVTMEVSSFSRGDVNEGSVNPG